MNWILKTIIIGIGATFTMDIWSYILSLFKIKSLDYSLLGRWVGYMPKGKFFHNKIFNSPSLKNELVIGWLSHYIIGISFAFLLVFVCSKDWLANPTFQPAILIGLVTIVAPFFIMQPAFGFGVALSDIPNPTIGRIKSLLTHTIFGIGLYLSAILLNKISAI
ncbi:DUF2938 domain-containing protein [Aquimarina macrocephali]|uniref:DUF2938 domain-containing protein n=1 Tax=Aquimarina macrocephali TaxID=666563 RepID=UPI000466D305|nr:DUF2938 domain-containing protein [Aquimarina macrocephali]